MKLVNLTDDEKRKFETSANLDEPSPFFNWFFDKASMARVLDMFLANPDSYIFTKDFLKKADISEKAFLKNIKILEAFGLVTDKWIGRCKFYKWEKTNPSAKPIMKLYDIINSYANNPST